MTPAITNSFERHAQTALVLLLVALLVWVGGTTQKTDVAIAELRAEVGFLKGSMAVPHLHPEITKVDLQLAQVIDTLRKRVSELESREHERLTKK